MLARLVLSHHHEAPEVCYGGLHTLEALRRAQGWRKRREVTKDTYNNFCRESNGHVWWLKTTGKLLAQYFSGASGLMVLELYTGFL